VLPFVTLLFVGFLLLIDKLADFGFIPIEVVVLIHSEMTVVAGDLRGLESFHVIVDRHEIAGG
jgi:hypothetical protein